MVDIGQVVVHQDHGLCKIIGMEHVNYVDKDYYVMYAKNDQVTKIMVPCDKIDTLCRRVITEEECLKVIDQIKNLDEDFITDNKKRKEEYLKMLQSGDLLNIAHLIKLLYHLFEEKKANNKAIGTVDISMFNDAKNRLFSEMQYVLKLNSFDDVELFIKNRIEN